MLPYNRQLNKYFAYPLTHTDNQDLTYSVVAIIAGTIGDIKVTTVNNDIVTFKNTNFISCQIKKVWDNGTTASELTGIVLKTHTLKVNASDLVEFITDQDGSFILDQDGNEIQVL